ncbi:GDSL-type esterase/lipase family protein [Dyadobacter sp.]|uniref:GDSL-type esterase/lipase family protein n=1 Tax=Dyadobacter sp. TaxID=1914288 RepID=UPI003F6FCE5B
MHNIKSLLIFSLMIGLILPSHETIGQGTVNKLKELNQRDGLPNFFFKVKSGESVSVAYLGGSITAAGHGWRDLTFSWLSSNFPRAKFKQINAGVGGTGSNLGVFRLKRDVLLHKPDLIFVEFAVNDDKASSESIFRSMEGIVRQIWAQNPSTDICYVYTIAESGVPYLKQGKYQNAAAAMERIADHYGIPSIHLGVEVVKLLVSEQLVFTGDPTKTRDKIVFTKDKTHPLINSGHPIYARVVERSLTKMRDSSYKMPHILREAYTKDNWEKAKMVSLSEIRKNDKWQLLPESNNLVKRFSKSMSHIFRADAPGASFSVKFRGKILGIYDIIGPDSGIVEVIIDGEPSPDISRFDKGCAKYRRNFFFLNEMPFNEHEVTFKVSEKQLNKASILGLKTLPIKDAAQYNSTTWLVNNLLIMGDLIE